MLANTQLPSSGEAAVVLIQFGDGGSTIMSHDIAPTGIPAVDPSRSKSTATRVARRNPKLTPDTTFSSCRWPTRQASDDCIPTRTGRWLRAAGDYSGKNSDVLSFWEYLDVCSVWPPHCCDVVNLGWPPRPLDLLASIIDQNERWRRAKDNMTKSTLDTIQNAAGINDQEYVKVSAEKPISSNSCETLSTLLVGHQRDQRTTKTRQRKQPFTIHAPARLPVAPARRPTAKQRQRRKP